jgi:hypothetical protein
MKKKMKSRDTVLSLAVTDKYYMCQVHSWWFLGPLTERAQCNGTIVTAYFQFPSKA